MVHRGLLDKEARQACPAKRHIVVQLVLLEQSVQPALLAKLALRVKPD